jgi:hypothetical protein
MSNTQLKIDYEVARLLAIQEHELAVKMRRAWEEQRDKAERFNVAAQRLHAALKKAAKANRQHP